MITFKIFIALLYIVYLLAMIISGFYIMTERIYTKYRITKNTVSFIGFMMIVDHAFLLWIVVNYIRFLIGR